jgi:hypothetical protein
MYSNRYNFKDRTVEDYNKIIKDTGLGTKENPIWVDVTHFKDMCDLLKWMDKKEIRQSIDNDIWLFEELPMTTEEVVLKFIKENGGTDRW